MRYTYQGKTIGKLEGGIFKKTVQKSEHLFRVTNSWAIQDEVLKELPDETLIEVFDKEEKILYTVTAGEFRENCDYFTFRNHGLQGYLPLKFWRVEKTARVLEKNDALSLIGKFLREELGKKAITILLCDEDENKTGG